jgi:hypothetical protein
MLQPRCAKGASALALVRASGPCRQAGWCRGGRVRQGPRARPRHRLWPGAETAIWPLGRRETLRDPGTGIAPLGGNRKRSAFPCLCATVPCRPAGPGPAEASARPGGCKAPAGGGPGAGRGLWPPAGLGAAERCGRGDGPCQRDRASRSAQERPSGRDQETRPAFPRLCGTVPCRPASPGTAEGQRPARRGRSARRGRVGRWPGALAPGWS